MHFFADIAGLSNDRALLCQGHGPFTELELRNGRAHRSCLYAGHARTTTDATTTIDPPHSAASPAVPALLGPGPHF
jgi:hypothetical protein